MPGGLYITMAKNPWIAALLSFLLTGLGQVYVGRYLRGAVLFLMALSTGYLFLEAGVDAAAAANVAVSLYSMWDAYRQAKAARAGVWRETLPAEPQGPELRAY
jgi:TM2 domain-containing membrane protein YozV